MDGTFLLYVFGVAAVIGGIAAFIALNSLKK